MNEKTKAVDSQLLAEAWSTQDEINFIKNLGSHQPKASVHKFDRKELLKGYSKAIRKRTDWDVMKKDHVINYLAQVIYTC